MKKLKYVYKIAGLAIAVLLGYMLLQALMEIPFGTNRMFVAKRFIFKEPYEVGAANTVTAIVVNYRGFDTLGEVTVLFIAATGVALLLHRERGIRLAPTETTLVVKTGARVLLPAVLLVGLYIFVHGHLTPGGGFPGGVIVASALILMYFAYEEYVAPRSMLHLLEGIAGLVFVIVGILGIIVYGRFLQNVFPLGDFGRLFSAGFIPIVYVAIGAKVGSELAGIIHDMIRRGGESE